MQLPFYLVILAGGSGTRLWPLSRESFPKQFLKVGSSSSLVQDTFHRLDSLVPLDHIFVVCGRDQYALMRKDFPEFSEGQFLLEPSGKNTAAAIALAAHVLNQKDPQATMVVLPADNKISSEGVPIFQEIIKEALQFVDQRGGLVILGIKPIYPATGYGYILKGEKVGGNQHFVYRAKRFQEKPDLSTAQKYIEGGEYFWNGGMFVWRAGEYFHAYQKFLPQDAKAIGGLKGKVGSTEWEAQLNLIYPQLTSISVDYAVLEKSDSVYMMEGPFSWDDVGSLQSLFQYYPHDSEGNAPSGKVVLKDAKNNLVLSDEGMVACLGIKNLVVIRNKDAVLVIPRDRVQEVKDLLEELKKKGYDSYL